MGAERVAFGRTGTKPPTAFQLAPPLVVFTSTLLAPPTKPTEPSIFALKACAPPGSVPTVAHVDPPLVVRLMTPPLPATMAVLVSAPAAMAMPAEPLTSDLPARTQPAPTFLRTTPFEATSHAWVSSLTLTLMAG